MEEQQTTSISYSPIGFFRSPFKTIDGMPIQPIGGESVEAEIAILPEFRQGLQDLDGFSHIIVISHMHKAEGYSLLVKPFLDDTLHGVFATRSPKRPNSIGLSIMKLKMVTETSLIVEGVDVLNDTPVLDVKPYVAEFDAIEVTRSGWFEEKAGQAQSHRSDDRFG